MPSTKNRVMVPLSDQAYATLLRVAALDDMTVGRLVAKLLEPAIPALQSVANAADAFTALKTQTIGGLAGAMGEAQGELEAVLRVLEASRKAIPPEASSGLPERPVTGPGHPEHTAQGAAVAGPRPPVLPVQKGREGPPRPPYSNTGVRLTPSERNQGVSKGGRKRSKSGVRHAS